MLLIIPNNGRRSFFVYNFVLSIKPRIYTTCDIWKHFKSHLKRTIFKDYSPPPLALLQYVDGWYQTDQDVKIAAILVL